MSPRPPPKFSLKHEWTSELGPKIARQPEGNLLDNQKEKLLDKQIFSNQPNQLQIQFVTDRGDLMTCKMEETRPVLRRSMLILLTKNSVLQTERGVNVEQTHDRTVRPVATLHKAEAQDGSQVCHEGDALNVDDEILRKRMENPLLFMTRIMNR